MSKKDLADSLNSTSMDLLDLSARNRLINTSRSSARSSRLDVVDELSSEVFRILVAEGKKMTFLPNPKASDSDDSSEDEQQQQTLPQPDDNDPADGMPAARHTDSKLQTKLASEKLQTRLLSRYLLGEIEQPPRFTTR